MVELPRAGCACNLDFDLWRGGSGGVAIKRRSGEAEAAGPVSDSRSRRADTLLDTGM
jgi:hypothetical protein